MKLVYHLIVFTLLLNYCTGNEVENRMSKSIDDSKTGLSEKKPSISQTLNWLNNVAGYRIRDGVPFKSIDQIQNLTKLQIHGLTIGTTTPDRLIHQPFPLTDENLVNIVNLKKITDLDLSGYKVTDKGLVYIQNFKKLKSLYLTFEKLSGEGVKYIVKLKNLEELIITKSQVNDKSLFVLARLRRLKYFSVRSPNITDEGMEKLKQAMPNCEIRYEITKKD